MREWVPAELERELAAAEVVAIERGEPVELFDDLALRELELRRRDDDRARPLPRRHERPRRRPRVRAAPARAGRGCARTALSAVADSSSATAAAAELADRWTARRAVPVISPATAPSPCGRKSAGGETRIISERSRCSLLVHLDRRPGWDLHLYSAGGPSGSRSGAAANTRKRPHLQPHFQCHNTRRLGTPGDR